MDFSVVIVIEATCWPSAADIDMIYRDLAQYCFLASATVVGRCVMDSPSHTVCKHLDSLMCAAKALFMTNRVS